MTQLPFSGTGKSNRKSVAHSLFSGSEKHSEVCSPIAFCRVGTKNSEVSRGQSVLLLGPPLRPSVTSNCLACFRKSCPHADSKAWGLPLPRLIFKSERRSTHHRRQALCDPHRHDLSDTSSFFTFGYIMSVVPSLAAGAGYPRSSSTLAVLLLSLPNLVTITRQTLLQQWYFKIASIISQVGGAGPTMKAPTSGRTAGMRRMHGRW